ncbi:MAG: hypothetical protein U0X92_13305 [Anaerolineales bacterium]
MKKYLHIIFRNYLCLSLSACGLPTGSGAMTSAIEPTSSGDQVATVVASTMQALTPSSPDSPTPQPAGLLPSLYFINNDNAGIAQVFRLDADGKTTATGRLNHLPSIRMMFRLWMEVLLYVSNNQLLLINADGSGRRMLIDGGVVDENNPFVSRLSNPVFFSQRTDHCIRIQRAEPLCGASGVNNLVIKKYNQRQRQ